MSESQHETCKTLPKNEIHRWDDETLAAMKGLSSAVVDGFESDFSVSPEIRPSWDCIWMKMAHLIAERSIDPRLKCGAVIVNADNTQILSVGYNGNYRGGPNTVESTEPGKSGFIHAEENALIKLDYNLPCRKVMYLNYSPCVMCAKKIINANIDELVYDGEYRVAEGKDLLRRAGIVVRQFTP